MGEEIRPLEENKTWTIEAINCNWVFKVKYKLGGTTERFNTRLVVRDDHQVKGFDFTETFAPVSKMTTVRTFLSVEQRKDGNHIRWM